MALSVNSWHCIRFSANSGMSDLFCDCWAICMVNLWTRYALKLRSFILLQFGLISFRFAYMRTLKPLISMISEVSDVSLSPKTKISYLWTDQGTANIPRKIPKSFYEDIMLESVSLGKFGKFINVCPTHLEFLECIFELLNV